MSTSPRARQRLPGRTAHAVLTTPHTHTCTCTADLPAARPGARGTGTRCTRRGPAVWLRRAGRHTVPKGRPTPQHRTRQAAGQKILRPVFRVSLPCQAPLRLHLQCPDRHASLRRSVRYPSCRTLARAVPTNLSSHRGRRHCTRTHDLLLGPLCRCDASPWHHSQHAVPTPTQQHIKQGTAGYTTADEMCILGTYIRRGAPKAGRARQSSLATAEACAPLALPRIDMGQNTSRGAVGG